MQDEVELPGEVSDGFCGSIDAWGPAHPYLDSYMRGRATSTCPGRTHHIDAAASERRGQPQGYWGSRSGACGEVAPVKLQTPRHPYDGCDLGMYSHALSTCCAMRLRRASLLISTLRLAVPKCTASSRILIYCDKPISEFARRAWLISPSYFAIPRVEAVGPRPALHHHFCRLGADTRVGAAHGRLLFASITAV